MGPQRPCELPGRCSEGTIRNSGDGVPAAAAAFPSFAWRVRSAGSSTQSRYRGCDLDGGGPTPVSRWNTSFWLEKRSVWLWSVGHGGPPPSGSSSSTRSGDMSVRWSRGGYVGDRRPRYRICVKVRLQWRRTIGPAIGNAPTAWHVTDSRLGFPNEKYRFLPVGRAHSAAHLSGRRVTEGLLLARRGTAGHQGGVETGTPVATTALGPVQCGGGTLDEPPGDVGMPR